MTAAHGRGPQGEFRAQYHYDALGRRTRKQVSYKGKAAQSTRFLWQGYRLLRGIRTIKQTVPLSPVKTALNEGGV